MRKLPFHFFIAFLFCARFHGQAEAGKNLFTGKDTPIIGKALNAKSGAVIITADEQTYYIDSLDEWSEKYYGKILRVTGRLTNREFPGSHDEKPDPKKPLTQNSIGSMTVITRARWKVIK